MIPQLRAGELKLKTPETSDVSNVQIQEQAPSQSTRPRRRRVTFEETEALKPLITDLYIDQRLSFKEIQKVLSTQHNWCPT